MIIANKEILADFVEKHSRAMEKITTREQYDGIKQDVENLIAEATQKGMLEPDAVNEYTSKISELSRLMSDYEDNYLNIMPTQQDTAH